LTTVVVTHAGGQTIDISGLNIKVNGNTSVWGPTGGELNNADLYRPQPDHFEAATTNEPVTVSSGDRWTVNAYMGWPDERIKDKTIKGPYRGYYLEYSSGCVENGVRKKVDNPSVNLAADLTRSAAYYDTCTDRLTTGDELHLVWRSASGGKTQTLTRYTTQSDGSPVP
jgi:hypothetical protein